MWRFPTNQVPTYQSYVIKYSQGVEVPTDQASTDETYVTKYSQGVEVLMDQVYKKYRVWHNGLKLLCILLQGRWFLYG